MTVFDRMRRVARQRRFHGRKFALVSNNCWGAEVYKDLELPFTSPFIGLFLYPACYLELLDGFSSLIELPLSFARTSKYAEAEVNRAPRTYPIGVIGEGIEIHFLHYSDEDEARLKWERRVERMLQPGTDLFFKMCDRDGATTQQIDRFLSLPFENKVFFSAHPIPRTVWIEECSSQGVVADGAALFPIGLRYFDHVEWLNQGGLGHAS
jgi:uncharacterized protein (DUF1919 family)